MTTYVVDIETDGLISSTIHVMSFAKRNESGNWEIESTYDYSDMADLMEDPNNIIIGHNFKGFDAIELERVLGIEIKAKVIDTLALAWYIFPERRQGTYGLESFGKDYGIEKPKIDDWEGLKYEDYKHRCEEDVKINIKVWEDIQESLFDLYEDPEEIKSFINYLMFKMDCVADQRKIKCKIDVDMVNQNIEILEGLKQPKIDSLTKAMPPGTIIKRRPKVMYKKNGSMSSHGVKFVEMLREKNLPLDSDAIRDEANPASPDQLKDWLFSLGWEPEIYNDGANGAVPQVRDKDRELCQSVLKLVDKEPAINDLDGLSVINHRLGVLNSILDAVDKDGYVVASMAGLTNTLRLRHSKPIVNLPGVSGDIKKDMDKGLSKEEAISNNLRDGQIIRECIIAPEGYVLCGSDITSLEDNCKRHFMWDYDPEYVKDQMEEGYDPHLDLAVRAGAMTKEQVEEHKLYGLTKGKKGKNFKELRDIYKQANYSCIYGVGAPKLSKATGLTEPEARQLINAYWDRNWSIRQLPKDIKIKQIGDQQWLLNPVNSYYYSVRSEKDIFSTLNQGTGAFIFDCWLKIMRSKGVIPFLQYHDEKLSLCPIGSEDKYKEVLESSMEEVNDILNLNIEITVDVQFGETYDNVH